MSAAPIPQGVDRFTAEVAGLSAGAYPYPHMRDDDAGKWVRYTDHAAALAASEARVAEAQRKHAHTQQWYAERLERLKDLGKERGCWPEMAAIIANGSATRQLEDGSYLYEPPTYAQQLNSAKHRAEAAEQSLAEAVKLLDEAAPYVAAHAEASHLTDGFRRLPANRHDTLSAAIDAMLPKGEGETS